MQKMNPTNIKPPGIYPKNIKNLRKGVTTVSIINIRRRFLYVHD